MKKILSLALALALLLSCTAAFAAEVPTDTPTTGNKGSQEINSQAADTPKTSLATLLPEIEISDPGNIALKIEWIQPKLTFNAQALNYQTALEGVDAAAAVADLSTAGKALLTTLGVADTANVSYPLTLKGTDYADFTALKTNLLVPLSATKDTTYYYLSADSETKFTLTNTSKTGTDTGDAAGYFKGKLKIEAKQTDKDGETAKTLKLKGVETELITPMTTDADPQPTFLELLDKTTCTTLAEKIADKTSAEYTTQLNAYINDKAFSFKYKEDKTFIPEFTKGQDGQAAAAYYTTTPDAKAIQEDLTAYVNFTINIVKEKDAPAA